jgi:hypothetical protein
MNLIELIRPQNMIAYWDDSKANQQRYMGDWLFPHKKVVGLELSKVSGRAGLPVQLKASAFDTQPTYRDRIGVELKKTKLPFFRERMKIDEETRQQIMAISNDALLANYLGRIFDDVGNLRRGAKAQRERMAMELISTGHVKIEGNGVKLDYNYNLHKNQKVASSWANPATSKPIQDIIDWVDAFRTKFYVPLAYAVMNTKTFNLIKASDSVKYAIYPTATTPTNLFVTSPQVKDFVQTATGVRILINDNAYADTVGGAAKPFFPDYTISFLPVGGTLGNMVFGTTPEEIDLYTNPKVAGQTRITDTGVAVYTRVIDHPVNTEVIVSQICLPSFGADVEGGAGSILIADVK